jgi:hypothetical protein
MIGMTPFYAKGVTDRLGDAAVPDRSATTRPAGREPARS